MAQKVFQELLEVMKSRGGPYAGLDVPEFFALVEELFDPEEAEINNALSRKPAPVNPDLAFWFPDAGQMRSGSSQKQGSISM